MSHSTDLDQPVYGVPVYNESVNERHAQIALDEWNAPADEVDGYDLLKDDALYQLVGVPFRALKAIFRDGIQRKGVDYRDDYVSLEVVTAPAGAWDYTRINTRRRQMELDATTPIAKPGEYLVVNDGSTGLYRQIVQYLAAKGFITLPEGEEKGEKGESILDLPRSQWIDGAEKATEGIEINLKCVRGLRFSDYTNTYTGDDKARTWYLA